MNDYSGIKFLDKLYSNLYMSDVVQHTKERNDKRNQAIEKYLNRLEKIHFAANTESKKKLLLHLYSNKYVVKEEDLPNTVDKGSIINSQIRSLEGWLDYLSSPSASMFPMWTKYWAFQGMIKLGSYDSFKDDYQKRDKNTLNPFIEPNPEIIGKCMEIIIKLVKKEKIDTDIEEKLSKADSFKKIYLAVNRKYRSVLKKRSLATDGIWKKYINNNVDADILLHEIEYKNTGWCIANGTSIRSFLRDGDFYIYFTKDEKGEYIIPRIAILTKGENDIDQIRGIDPGENLEDSMINIVETKLKTMKFLTDEAVNNQMDIIKGLRELNIIGKKSLNKIKLTDEEFKHFYTKKYGFGYSQDPKHDRIINIRNIPEDYNSTNDKEVKLAMIIKGYVPDNFVKDKELMKEALIKFKGSFKYGAENIRGDKELFELSISGSDRYYDNLKFVTDEIGNDKDYIISLVKENSVFLEYANNIMKDDEDVVMAALKSKNRYNNTFDFASPRLKNDKNFILMIIDTWAPSCEFMDDTLKNDKEFVLKIIKTKYPDIIRFTPNLLKDQDIVAEALKRNGALIQFVNPIFKDNEEIVKLAINTFAPAFFESSPRLQENKELFKFSLSNYNINWKNSLLNANQELYKDNEILKLAIKYNGMVYQYASEIDKKNPIIALEAIKNDIKVIDLLPIELKNNESFMNEVKLIIDNNNEKKQNRNM